MAKILVVDDEAHLRRVVSLYLRGRHYDVETAENGIEAIEKVSTDRPDLIIADIGMPGMDGYELCSRLRRQAETRTIPFIFLTAKDQDTDRIRARKIGSDDYLTKPCPLDQLAERVEMMIDRIEQAKRIPLDRIGLSGRLDEVDVLDLVQMLELSQKTGALVLSHGERTGTLYFKEGVIVDADIRSPKREEPLFVLLGWKAGRYLFLPDAVPERMPITASLANLLFEDLRKLEQHQQMLHRSDRPSASQPGSGDVIGRLQRVSRRLRAARTGASEPHTVRVLIAGTAGAGKSEFICGLIRDLSPSCWSATGSDEPQTDGRTDFGLIRVSDDTVLHLVAVRAEKRFRPLWEHSLPSAVGIIVLAGPSGESELSHLQTFLKARSALAPSLPVHVILPKAEDLSHFPGLAAADISIGSIEDRSVRLAAFTRLLDQWLGKRDRDG
ncbi:response regulator [Candidatus Nitrospira bockiana]